MSDKSWSQRIWNGEYGGFFGFGSGGVLAEANATIEKDPPGISRASVLYSVVGDYELWRFWYWPLRTIAFWRFYTHTIRAEHLRFAPLTPDQCETLCVHSLWLSGLWFVPHYRRLAFEIIARYLAQKGLEQVDSLTSIHTRAFLLIHSARFHFKSGGLLLDPGGWIAKGLNELEVAARLSEQIANADQKTRVYRALAGIYHRIGEVTKPKTFMDLADQVPNIDKSTQRKNAKARKRMDL
ncbi:MAG: hypothetical protein Q7R47_03960 [Candidatus Diapherotrites archaeon]|nr:hypothetical protein [Candidatus Diapherotrites archaeon]